MCILGHYKLCTYISLRYCMALIYSSGKIIIYSSLLILLLTNINLHLSIPSYLQLMGTALLKKRQCGFEVISLIFMPSLTDLSITK